MSNAAFFETVTYNYMLNHSMFDASKTTYDPNDSAAAKEMIRLHLKKPDDSRRILKTRGARRPNWRWQRYLTSKAGQCLVLFPVE